MSFPSYPAYKDSGVEWLGDVPQSWSVYSLKRTVDGCVNGLWGDEPDGENDIAVIRVADFERSFSTVGLDKLTYRSITPKERQSRLIKSGDLLIEKSGGGEKTLVGCVVLFTHGFDAITSNFVARMRPLPEFDSQFLCYAFGNLYHGRVNYPSVKQVTGIQNLDAESYLQERFCFPARVEQTQIARFLDHETARIDALIEEQQRLIELLKEKRQAVISHAVTKGLDPMVSMKDSGVEWLGEVPAHWDVSRLKYHSTRIGDGLHSTPEYDDAGDYFFINGNNLVGGAITIAPTTRQVNRQEFLKHRVLLDSSTVLISINGTIGNLALYSGEPVILGKSAAYINCTESLLPRFCLYLFSSEQIKRFFESQLTGTTIYNLSLRTIAETPTPLPSIDEQNSIVEFLNRNVDGFDELIDNAMKLAQLLQERRSALISAAVTGKIDVRGWQPQVNAPSPELAEEAV